jgi:hypothetical protein
MSSYGFKLQTKKFARIREFIINYKYRVGMFILQLTVGNVAGFSGYLIG